MHLCWCFHWHPRMKISSHPLIYLFFMAEVTLYCSHTQELTQWHEKSVSYQDVPFQKKTRFDGDADAGLTVTLNITAKQNEATTCQTTQHSHNSFWCFLSGNNHMHMIYFVYSRSLIFFLSALLGWFWVLLSTWFSNWESRIKGWGALILIMWAEGGIRCGAFQGVESLKRDVHWLFHT